MTSTRALSLGLGLLAVASTASATDVTGSLNFVGITPCRIADTRGLGFSGQAGPPALVPATPRTFQITGDVPGVPAQCGIPTTARAVSVNFTVTNFTSAGNLVVFPAGGTPPLASILNFKLQNIANATTVPLGPSGGGEFGIAVQANVSGTDFIADVNGYYVPRPFTLESGQTLKGTYSSVIVATGAGIPFGSALTYQSPLETAPSAPAVNFIPLAGAPTVSCPGTAANPQALAGNLCVYEALQANRTFNCMVSAGTQACNSSDTFGAGLVFTSNGFGVAASAGTWAVTAP
jgi:hypothetical protein